MANGIGAFFAQGQIVLGGATGIGMTCNHDLCIRVVAEVVREFVELGAFLSLNREAVVGKEDCFGFEGFVISGVGIAGAFRQGLVINIVGAIAKGCAVSFFIFVCAPGKDGEEG